jgi:hypothetical protein
VAANLPNSPSVSAAFAVAKRVCSETEIVLFLESVVVVVVDDDDDEELNDDVVVEAEIEEGMGLFAAIRGSKDG